MARRLLTPNTAPPPTATGTAAHSGWDVNRSAVKVAIVGNVVVVLLFFVAVVWRLFFSGKGQEGTIAPEGGGAAAAEADALSSAESSPSASPRGKGLRKEDLVALPVYVHGAGASAEEGSGGKVECAVCICELGDGDTGRLLPRCGHRFHAECVDRWFRSHATCPLCRTVVGGQPQGAAAEC
ncbi:RING-H2 finger protein ATL5-like [Lolium rigidum]|uniref:RING-H2 finger protein ATL5-like n=1 Tax=Lolium rigidum TaxID=89674 RepID=UPI001F5D00BF|nr:RING-H2 finger protein ATL5-like [Lolium rigidum]